MNVCIHPNIGEMIIKKNIFPVCNPWDFATKKQWFFKFFIIKCNLRMFNDSGEVLLLRAVLCVYCSWSGKTNPGIKWHKKPMSPSPSHFSWTGNSGFQSLDWRKAQTNNRVKKTCFQNQTSNICPIKNASIHLIRIPLKWNSDCLKNILLKKEPWGLAEWLNG